MTLAFRMFKMYYTGVIETNYGLVTTERVSTMSAKSNAPVFALKRKLSSKEIMGGDIKKMFILATAEGVKSGKPLTRFDLYRVGGVVKRCESVETNFGDSTRLIGDFLAVNKQTGEMFRSNRLFLPSIISEEMEAAVDPSTKSQVEFAFDIYIIPDDKSATGYVYMAEPVVKARESDAMAQLAGKMGITLGLPEPKEAPALPAPETAKASSAATGKKDDGKGKK